MYEYEYGHVRQRSSDDATCSGRTRANERVQPGQTRRGFVPFECSWASFREVLPMHTIAELRDMVAAAPHVPVHPWVSPKYSHGGYTGGLMDAWSWLCSGGLPPRNPIFQF